MYVFLVKTATFGRAFVLILNNCNVYSLHKVFNVYWLLSVKPYSYIITFQVGYTLSRKTFNGLLFD